MASAAEPSARIELGPFAILERVGKGGLGQVWRGVHIGRRIPAAVKVLMSDMAREPGFVESFHREVRAVASLSHPHIVLVFDHGEVSVEAEARSGGELVSGSPWLAMEYARDGDLRALRGRMAWPELRGTLLCVLDALAHAHARGVIHRDLKPGNVVLGCARPGPKLVDFGLATGFETDRLGAGDDDTYGTPAVMAPEQLAGSWRDFGPWTDLYALGCTAWILAAGAPPFRGTRIAVMRGQLREDPPAFQPTRAVPAGFEGWLRTLMEKDPARRFRRAADAAWALGELGPALGGMSAVPDVPAAAISGDVSHITTLFLPVGGEKLEPAAPPQAAPPLALRLPPPMPPTWSAQHGVVRAPRVVGSGLGLYGLRQVPFVARAAERGLLWDCLADVRESGRAHGVVLAGPSGTGKSRLARWLVERAHEVGAAETFRVSHGRSDGPHDGLDAMFERVLRCSGLSGGVRAERVQQGLRRAGLTDPGDMYTAISILDPDARSPDRGERFALIRRFLTGLTRSQGARTAGGRAVVLWVDDAQWGPDSLAFVEHVLRSRDVSEDPILMVLTLQEDALPGEDGSNEDLAALRRHPDVSPCRVDNLTEEAMAALLDGLLELDPAVTGQVAARSAGNPLFAVQLVGDWVRRELLVPGKGGFRLKAGAAAELPAGVDGIWRAHADRVLSDRSEAEGSAIELAAVIGHGVDGEEWAAACAVFGVPVPWELVEALVADRLAVLRPDSGSRGWAFAHGMLRETFLHRAEQGGRLQRLHEACAAMLTQREDPRLASRIGRHLASAGRHGEAVEPLLAGIGRAQAMGMGNQASFLADLAEQAMDQAGLPDPSLPRVRLWMGRAKLAIATGAFGEIGGWATRVLQASRENGWAELEVDALLDLGRAARFAGDPTTARECLDRAADRAEEAGYAYGLAIAAKERAWTQNTRGRAGSALEGFARARLLFVQLGRESDAVRCLLGMSRSCRLLGRHDESEAHAREVLLTAGKLGLRHLQAIALQDLGEHARVTGDLERADGFYAQAVAQMRELGQGDAIYPEFNRGMVLVARGDPVQARGVFERCLRQAEALGDRTIVLAGLIGLMRCAAETGEWGVFDRHQQGFEDAARGTELCEVDMAQMAQEAGELAVLAGEGRRARLAFEIAYRQWSMLGQDRELARTVAAMAALKGLGPAGAPRQ